MITPNERSFFSELTIDYMTGESDCSDSDSELETGSVIVVHKIPWRSESEC